MANRPAQEVALDPWVELNVIQEKQRLIRLQADIANECRDDEQYAVATEQRHKRAMSRHKQYGYVGIAVAIVAGILGTIFISQQKMNDGAAQRLRSEELRTEQVVACTSLTEPIERQYCLLTLGLAPVEED